MVSRHTLAMPGSSPPPPRTGLLVNWLDVCTVTRHCQGCGPAPIISSDQPNSACLSGDLEGSAQVADDSATPPTQTLTSPQLCAVPRLRGVAVSFLRQVFILAKVTVAFSKNSSGVGAAFPTATGSVLGEAVARPVDSCTRPLRRRQDGDLEAGCGTKASPFLM